MRYQPRCSTAPELSEPGLAFGCALTFMVVAYLVLLAAALDVVPK